MKNVLLVNLLFSSSLILINAQQWDPNGNNYTIGTLRIGYDNSESGDMLKIKTINDKRAIAVFGATGTGAAGIYFDASNGDCVGIDYGSLLQLDDLSIEMNNYGNNPINFKTNNEKRLCILGNGNVGIGKNSPDYALDVERANQNVARFTSTGTNVGPDVLIIDKDNSNTRAAFQVQGNSGSIESLFVSSGGYIGIGTTSPGYKLDVIGTIRAREIKVDLNGADFVFEPDYELRSLNEVETFIKENKHLPEIDPASEMEAEGANLGELNTKLLQKIEELTLYTIEQQKEIERLKERLDKVEKE